MTADPVPTSFAIVGHELRIFPIDSEGKQAGPPVEIVNVRSQREVAEAIARLEGKGYERPANLALVRE